MGLTNGDCRLFIFYFITSNVFVDLQSLAQIKNLDTKLPTDVHQSLFPSSVISLASDVNQNVFTDMKSLAQMKNLDTKLPTDVQSLLPSTFTG